MLAVAQYKKTLFALLGILPLLFMSSMTQAEQYKTLGQWDVHYIVFNTSFLTPEIARAYGLQRSKYQGLVNISVLDKDSHTAQSVSVMGNATNLLGTKKELLFKEVQDGEAIYYLAVLPFRHDEQYRFEIDLRHGNKAEKLTFKHRFYSE